MCLGLEMMRHRDLKVIGSVDVGSGMGCVQVDTPTDVRVYIDHRCPETVDWFEKTFCTAESAGKGLKVEAGGQQTLSHLLALSDNVSRR